MEPKGKIVRKPKKEGGFDYEVEGDTDTRNTNYYKQKIEEMKASEFDDELDESLKTTAERLNQAKDDDPELPRLQARYKHLQSISSRKK